VIAERRHQVRLPPLRDRRAAWAWCLVLEEPCSNEAQEVKEFKIRRCQVGKAVCKLW